jgi:hypothetical protein
MALQKGWFKHARRDFERFASLGTKRIGTWPPLTLPWITRCPNTPICLISLLTFYFLGNILFHLFPLLLKWTSLWTWTLHPLRLGSSQRGLLYSKGLCPWPWKTCPLHIIETPYGIHTRVGSYKLKVRQFDVGGFVYLQRQPNDTLDISSDRTISRIKAIRPSGLLELQRVDGCTIRDHSKNCAPCHLSNLDPTIITLAWIPPLDYPC